MHVYQRAQGVAPQLLDLFPKAAVTKHSAAAWRDEHRFYSLVDLEREPYANFYGATNQAPPKGLEVMHGGIRSSAFGVRGLLTKHPLLFPSRGIAYWHAHHVRGARVADVTAVLLHYKYVGDFAAYVNEVVNMESFSMNSREYKPYQRALEINPELTLCSRDALEFSTVEGLVGQGFLLVRMTSVEKLRSYKIFQKMPGYDCLRK